MVSFRTGWNFAPPTGLKYCCDYMLNFSPGAKRKFPWESLLKCKKTVDAHARIPFSARDEKNDYDYLDFSARLAGLKILARFENSGLGFLARAELRAGLNPSPCNRQFDFKRTCFRSRAEISAQDEIRNVIKPLVRYARHLFPSPNFPQRPLNLCFAAVKVWNPPDESIKLLPFKTLKNKVKCNILQSHCSGVFNWNLFIHLLIYWFILFISFSDLLITALL